MDNRINTIKTIAKHRIIDTLISPVPYITTSLGLLIAFFLITNFLGIIDSHGLNFELNPFYNIVFNLLRGTFGTSFVEKLFNNGPYLFILIVSFIPFAFYLALSSIYCFAIEKKTAVYKNITSRPEERVSYIIASLVRDIFFIIIYLLIIIIFSVLTALLHNLVIDSLFFFGLLMLIFVFLAISTYRIFCSAISKNAFISSSLFIAIIIFLFLIQVISYSIASGYLKNLTNLLSLIFQWFSPLFYWSKGLEALSNGNILLYFFYMLFIFILSTAVLFLSNLLLKLKGVNK